MDVAIRPNPSYRASFRRGDSGWDVAALQINVAHFVGIAFDGVFGPLTDAAVRHTQGQLGLVVDGIAGPVTQRAICLHLARPRAAAYNLTYGLIDGLIENESGYMLACFTQHKGDSGCDLGACQKSIVADATQDQIAFALDVDRVSRATAMMISSKVRLFSSYGKVNAMSTIRCAVLNHNWPAAADRIARGLSIYLDPDRDNIPQAWVEAASGGRLHTATEWVVSYIARATRYVRTWPL